MKIQNFFSLCLALLFLCISFVSTTAQTVSRDTAYFKSNVSLANRKYNVPSNINVIVINCNVKVRGQIIIPDSRSTNLTIMGKCRTTSILHGFIGTGDLDNHGIVGTNFAKTLYLTNFSSIDPDGFHMRLLKAKVVANKVTLKDLSTCTTCNTDGFSGGNGSTYTNCEVNTNDDSFKVYYGNYTIKNTTIYHNKNGSPIQNGWGDTQDNATVVLDNVTVIANNSSSTYTQGVIAWVNGTLSRTRTFEMKNGGLKISVPSGKTAPKLYSYGNGSSSASNKTYIIKGSNCASYAQTSSNVQTRNSNNKNNKVITCPPAAVTASDVQKLTGEAVARNSFKVYPNPVSGESAIQLVVPATLVSQSTEKVQVKIYTQSGQVVKSWSNQAFQQLLSLPNHALTSGQYIISMETSKGAYSQPLFVK